MIIFGIAAAFIGIGLYSIVVIGKESDERLQGINSSDISMQEHQTRKNNCQVKKNVLYFETWETTEQRRLYPLYLIWRAKPSRPNVERGALLMYVTYSDLIQIGIFICTLVGLCYTIFKGKRK